MRSILSTNQTQKSRTERYDNVKDIITIDSNWKLEGKHIHLVDDVLTTGATICEAGKILINQGANISIATIARA